MLTAHSVTSVERVRRSTHSDGTCQNNQAKIFLVSICNRRSVQSGEAHVEYTALRI